MQIATFFSLYSIALPLFVLADILWLGVIAKGFYHAHLGSMLGPVNWVGALVFYAIFVAGLVYFALLPSLESGSYATALMLGALYGFFTYATYDLTNWATLRDWPLIVTIVDICWGAALGALIASVTHTIYTVIFG